MLVRLRPIPDSAQLARQAVTETLTALGRLDLIDDATLVVSELVANGVLHARTEISLTVEPVGAGIRVSVSDGSNVLPRWHPAASLATSGRGLLLVERLSSTWGVQRLAGSGKVIWAQIDQPADPSEELTAEGLLELWAEDRTTEPPNAGESIRVELEVDVRQMLDSRAHTEDLVRELQLILLGRTSTASRRRDGLTVLQVAAELDAANEAFHDARRQILTETLRAAQQGRTQATLQLQLHHSDLAAAKRWLAALDQADALTEEGTLLLPPFPYGLAAFRRNYIAAIIDAVQRPSTATPRGPTPRPAGRSCRHTVRANRHNPRDQSRHPHTATANGRTGGHLTLSEQRQIPIRVKRSWQTCRPVSRRRFVYRATCCAGDPLAKSRIRRVSCRRGPSCTGRSRLERL